MGLRAPGVGREAASRRPRPPRLPAEPLARSRRSLLLLGTLLVSPAEASGPELLAVALQAQVAPAGDEVRLRAAYDYRSSGEVPSLLLLSFPGAVIDGLVATVDGVAWEIDRRSVDERAAELAFAPKPVAPPGGVRRLDLSYSVRRATSSADVPKSAGEPRGARVSALAPRRDDPAEGDRRWRLPVPVPRWAPPAERPELFTAFVGLPPGSALVDPFPTVATLFPPSAPGPTYRFALPAVPSHLAFDQVDDGATVSRLPPVDVAVVVLLLASLALVGRQILREGR